ncbi:hypothetical protein [Brevibacillus choshinensis]|uniref:hypothetical protein n=1 Tax=Brevibacillus choshinensis TaxID=54911 RepID=UPI002E1CEDCF|nr:hypothetical protein [Brevibacillus choshinensis]
MKIMVIVAHPQLNESRANQALALELKKQGDILIRGDNYYTISELLRPIERTLTRCNGTFLPAFVTYDANQATDEYLAREAKRYAEHVQTSLYALAH